MSRMKSVVLAAIFTSLLLGALSGTAVAINKPVASNVDTHVLLTPDQSKVPQPSTTLASPTEVWVDDSWNNQGDVDLYNPSLIFGYDAFNTIQGGIDGVTGSTVHILAGTYIENITVNKSVELSGAGAGSCLVYPLLSAPMPGAGSSLPDGASNLILVQANDVTISGLTLDGDNPGLTSEVVVGGADIDARNGIITDHRIGLFNNLEIHDVTIKNIYLRGIYASSGGTFNFHHNTVQNVNGEANSIGIFNFGGSGIFDHNVVSDCNDAISSNHSKGCQFTYNTVTNSSSGIHTDNAGDAGGTADLIENNSVSNGPAGGYGIWVFVPYIAPLVNSNTISNVEIGLTYACSYSTVTTRFTNNIVDGMGKLNSTGLYVTTESWWWASGNVTSIFENNYIIGNTDGAYIVAEAGFTNTITLFNNSISGNMNSNISNGTGALGAGTFDINASGNWWGSNVPATIAASLSAGIDYTPWLDTGADVGDPGFRGDFNALWVDDDSPQRGAVGRIREAVNGVLSGGTVHVVAGTYNEIDITINKAISVIGNPGACGPGPDAPVLQGAGAGISERGFIITAGTDNVLIDGFIIQNYGGIPNDYGGSCGIWSYGTSVDPVTNVTVQNCEFNHIRWAGIFFYNEGHSIFDNIQVNCNIVNMDDGTANTANSYGIECTNCKNSVISNNTVVGGFTGILMTAQALRSTPTSVTVENNTISGNTVTGSVGWTGNVGIVSVRDPVTNSALIQNITIEGNVIANSVDAGNGAYGIRTYALSGGTFAGPMKVYNNSFSGNASKSLDNLTGLLWDASGNYWGSNDPAVIAAAVSSNVDYTPWMQNAGTILNPGFSGDFSALSVNDVSPQSGSIGRIQEAGSAILSGGTVNVLAGTYTDNVIVDKPMTLLGAGAGTCIVYPALSAPNPGGGGSLPAGASNMVLVQASGVTITGFTFDGNNPSLTSGVVFGGADLDARNGIITNHNLAVLYDNLTVSYCTVKNIYLRGIYASTGGTFNFHHNTIDNVQGESASIGIFNFYGAGVFDHNTVSNCNDAIASNWSSGCTFTYNTVTNSGTGIHTDNAGNAVGSTADLIQNNNISNSRVNGYGIFVFAPYLAPVVDLNTITNVDVALTCAGSYVSVTPQFTNNTLNGMGKPNSAGVYVTTEIWGYESGNVSVHFEHNAISGFTEGVYLVGETSKTNSTTLLDNDIQQNGLGISNGVGLTFGGGPNVGAVVSASQNAIDNTVNATDNKAGNTYNQNCWSDWSGVGPYAVGGSGGNFDNNPALHCGFVLCGDADGSSAVDIGDPVFLISYIFKGGVAPDPLGSGDVDCNNQVDIADAVYLINYIFKSGAAPCADCK